MEAIRNSIVAHKGHLTRVLKSVKKLIPFAVKNPTPELARDLEDALAALRCHHAAIMAAYLELGLITIEPADHAEQAIKMGVVENDFLQGLADVMDALKLVNTPAAVPVVAPAPPARAPSAPQYKVQTALQPDKLTREATPSEMRSWVRNFRAFYSTSNLDRATLEYQQAIFLQ
jgi:hypothetical protein